MSVSNFGFFPVVELYVVPSCGRFMWTSFVLYYSDLQCWMLNGLLVPVSIDFPRSFESGRNVL